MQRATTDPRQRQWIIHIQWLGRRVGRDTLVARYARRRKSRRARKASDAALLRSGTTPPRERRWYDAIDLGVELGDVPIVLVVLVVIVLLIWLGPGLIALLLGLGEFLAVLFAALAVWVWRTVARRPWAVIATDGVITYTWSVTGYRRARALVRSAAASIHEGLGIAGVDPALDAGVARRSETTRTGTDPH
jgi:hypothetical protein